MKYILFVLSFLVLFTAQAQDAFCKPRQIEQLSKKIIAKLTPSQIASITQKEKWDALEGELNGVYEIQKKDLTALYDYVYSRGCKSFFQEKAEDAIFSYVYYKIQKKDTCLSKLLEPEIAIVLQQQKHYKEHIVADSIEGIYIPRNLEDCFSQLNYYWSDTVKSDILGVSEEAFVANMHLGLGMWIRNNWRLWSGSRLSEYFNYLGVNHPDDMSAIILVSYHRHLSQKPVKLEEQVLFYQDYWKKMGNSEKKPLKKNQN